MGTEYTVRRGFGIRLYHYVERTSKSGDEISLKNETNYSAGPRMINVEAFQGMLR